jgi:hypothetical protein
MIDKKMWHRETYIFVENLANKFIITKCKQCDEYHYKLTTGGYVGPDETNEESAIRILEDRLHLFRGKDEIRLLD